MNDTPWPLDTPKTQFKVRLQPTAQDRGHRPLCRGVRDYRLTTLVLERRLGQVLCNMETCQGGPRLTLHSPGVSGHLIIGWNEWREWHLSPGAGHLSKLCSELLEPVTVNIWHSSISGILTQTSPGQLPPVEMLSLWSILFVQIHPFVATGQPLHSPTARPKPFQIQLCKV